MASRNTAYDAMTFHAATKLDANESMWARLFRPFTVQSPSIHRFLPKLKAGKLMLEIDAKADWMQLDVVLAGSSIGDLGLYYYRSQSDPVPMGCIQLHSAHIDVLEEVVMVVTHEKTWFLCAEHARDANDWAEAICASIDKVSQGVLLQGEGSSSTRSGKRRRLSSHASHITLRELKSREPRARVEEFLEIFVRSYDEDIRLQAIEGALSWSCMRSLAWKLWLDVIPIDVPFRQWIPILNAKRHKYETLRSGHAIFDCFAEGTSADEEFIATCETSEDNLLYSIYKDVRRTRGTMEFFRVSSLQCLLIRVLYTYSHAHPEISYNQGMGELLATIVYLLHVEQWPKQRSSLNSSMTLTKTFSNASLTASSSTGSFVAITPSGSAERLSDISDSDDASYVYVDSFIDIQDDTAYLDREKFLRSIPLCGGTGKYLECCKEAVEELLRDMTNCVHIEHDAYLLLEELMHRMGGAYCPELTTVPASKASNPSKAAIVATEMASSPLYDQMNSIHDHILSRCDPLTARHLCKLGVEPQMFMLRWVRVLMSREFDMAQVWQIWDAIFSLTPHDFSFINVLCVAVVREFREEILQAEDPTAVLLLLRDVPEKIDAERLVENAKDLYDALVIAAAAEEASCRVGV